MAMAPLFNRIVKGTHMEEVLKYMESNNIDVLRFDSAIKVGMQEGKDLFKDGSTRDKLNDFENWPVYTQYFRNLKYQVETTEHADVINLVSSQVPKVVMADIDPNAMYGSRKGSDIIADMVEARKGIAEAGSAKVKSQLGIKNDRVDKSLFIGKLHNDSISSGKNRIMRSAIKMDSDGNEYLHLDAFPDKMWFYTRINSIIRRNVVDLYLPSKQLTQVSDYGFGKKNPKKVYDGELKFLKKNSKGELVYELEARISKSMFRDIIPGYSKLSAEQIKEIVQNKVKLLGFRVPTQGKSSIVVINIVDVLDDSAGDVIHLPLEFTALTGSDFDIDKLFVIRKNYDYIKGELVETNYSKDQSDSKLYNLKTIEIFRNSKNLLDPKFVAEVHKRIKINSNRSRNLLDLYWKKYWKIYNLLRDNRYKNLDREKLLNQLSFTMQHIDDLTEYLYDNADVDYSPLSDEDLLNDIKYRLIKEGLLPTFDEFTNLPTRKKLTKKANENWFIDTLFEIMEARETLVDNLTPLGVFVKLLKEKASTYRKMANTVDSRELMPLESKLVSYQSAIKTKYTSAKAGTSRVVLYKGHHSISQWVGLRKRSSLAIGKYDPDSRTVSLSESIGDDGYSITQWMSALIDAHVDATKDPYIADLNVNDSTYDQLLYLLRIGVGEKAFDLILQPIITEYSKEYFNNIGDVKVIEKLQGKVDITEGVISEIARRWLNKYNALTGKEYKNLAEFIKDSENRYDNNSLLSSIELSANEEYVAGFEGQTDREIEFVRKQLQILNLFNKIHKDAIDVNTLVVGSRIDVAGYGYNPLMYRNSLAKLQNIILHGPFINADKLIDPFFDDNSSSDKFYFTSMIKNGVLDIPKSLQNMTLLTTAGFNKLFDLVIQSLPNSGQYVNNSDIITINNAIYAYLFAPFFENVARSLFKDETSYVGTLYHKILNMSGGESVFEDLDDIKNNKSGKFPSDLRDTAFIQNMDIHYVTKRSDFSNEVEFPTHIIVKGGLTPMEEERMIMDWEEMFSSDNENVKNFAVKLLLYNFLSTGQRQANLSLTRFIPPSILREVYINGDKLSFNDHIGKLLEELSDDAMATQYYMDFRKQLGQNTWWSDHLVPTINKRSIKKEYRIGEGVGKPHYVAVKLDRRSSLKLGVNDNYEEILVPYIKGRVVAGSRLAVLEYVGYSKAEGMYFFRVLNRKGFASRISSAQEFGMPGDVSLFPGNNVLSVDDYIPSVDEVVSDIESKFSDFTRVDPMTALSKFAVPEGGEYIIYNNFIQQLAEGNELNEDTTAIETGEIPGVVATLRNGIPELVLDLADSLNIPTSGYGSIDMHGGKYGSASNYGVKEVGEEEIAKFKEDLSTGRLDLSHYITSDLENNSTMIAEWFVIKDSDAVVFFTFKEDFGDDERAGVMRKNHLLRTMNFALSQGKPFFVVTAPDIVEKVSEAVNMLKNRSSARSKLMPTDVPVITGNFESAGKSLAKIALHSKFGSVAYFADSDLTDPSDDDFMYSENVLRYAFKYVYDLAETNNELEDKQAQDPTKPPRAEDSPEDGNDNAYSSPSLPLVLITASTDNRYVISLYHSGLKRASVGYNTEVISSDKDFNYNSADNKSLLMNLYGIYDTLKNFEDSSEYIEIYSTDDQIINITDFREYSDSSVGLKPEAIDVSSDTNITKVVDLILTQIANIEDNGGSVKFKWVPRDYENNQGEYAELYPELYYDEYGVPDSRKIDFYSSAVEDVIGNLGSTSVYNTIRDFADSNINDSKNFLSTIENMEDEEKEGKDNKDHCEK